MISTINARIGEREINTGFHVTNPEPLVLQKLLVEMVNEKMEYAVVEVTSHGIDQGRIAGVDFYGVAITNVTHEHLDYHKTYEDYLQTKGKILKDVKFRVLNRDDESYKYLSEAAVGRMVSFGCKSGSDVFVSQLEVDSDSSRFIIVDGRGTTLLHSNVVRLSLPGVYNIYNASAAAAVCLELGLTLAEIKNGLETFTGLIGRFEKIDEDQDFKVIVDFAHTPNALKRVLELISKIKDQRSKIIVVFGCAGLRDKTKRPIMGEIAGRLADISVLTAEDPRTENANDIINNIAVGCLKSGARELEAQTSGHEYLPSHHRFVRQADRRRAIRLALKLAQPGDTVIITGKGHEKSMCFGKTEYPWSDPAVVREELYRLKSNI